MVEFSALRAGEECVPFTGCEPQDWALRMFAVADADHAIGQGCYFDTVAIGEAAGAFDPSGLLHGVVSFAGDGAGWLPGRLTG
jgi:hypothetical protein